MYISIRQTSKSKPNVIQVLLMLALSSVMSLLLISSVSADNDKGGHGRGNKHNQGHRTWQRDRHSTVYIRPYQYAQPVYVPPPIYYAPQQSPGINLFFPLDFRHY